MKTLPDNIYCEISLSMQTSSLRQHLILSGRLPKFLITQIAPSFSVVSYNSPFILPSHLLRTSSYIDFFRIQCDFILYKKTIFFFIFSFIFILFHFFNLNFFFNYYHFFSCSGMFRDVLECSMFRVLSTAL